MALPLSREYPQPRQTPDSSGLDRLTRLRSVRPLRILFTPTVAQQDVSRGFWIDSARLFATTGLWGFLATGALATGAHMMSRDNPQLISMRAEPASAHTETQANDTPPSKRPTPTPSTLITSLPTEPGNEGSNKSITANEIPSETSDINNQSFKCDGTTITLIVSPDGLLGRFCKTGSTPEQEAALTAWLDKTVPADVDANTIKVTFGIPNSGIGGESSLPNYQKGRAQR